MDKNCPTFPSLRLKMKKHLSPTIVFFPILSLLFFFLLVNGVALLSFRGPFTAKTDRFAEVVAQEKRPSSSFSSIMYAVHEEISLSELKTNKTLRVFQKSDSNLSREENQVPNEDTRENFQESYLVTKEEKQVRNTKTHESFQSSISQTQSLKRSWRNGRVTRFLQQTPKSKRFSARAKDFFSESDCSIRFFMTWISSSEMLGQRELFSVQSIFKSNPDACLLIISSSMDSKKGTKILHPFISQGFRVLSISPDFDYIFKNTSAESWFDQLKQGRVNPGEVSLGQNLSNLLRLALLYKFGGVYLDTDVIVLKSFSPLRNVIGAQAADPRTGNWTRLNNAVMVFDKNHPLLQKFIEEFTLTFNGNIWGHNGPYLVSRVVMREEEEEEEVGCYKSDFRVFNPTAFYPVSWRGIQGLFQGPSSKGNSKWAAAKLEQIRRESFAVHLWNRQSQRLKVEDGSVIGCLMLDCCIFCSSHGGLCK